MIVKTLNRLWPQRHKYGYYISQFNVYQGEQVPAPKWAEPGTLALTTGDPLFPVRLISRDSIISIDETIVEQPKPIKDRVVTVKGSKGDTYIVTLSHNNTHCTCTGFGFRKSCKHIREAQNVRI
jgi:hypothetical protein